MNEFFSRCSNRDIQTLLDYTGYNYKFVNNILRGTWTYEENEILNEQVKKEWKSRTNEIKQIFLNVPDFLPADIKAYRGVSIRSFKDYGVAKLEDLNNLVGCYYHDFAFTSTSLLRDRSFFDRKLDYHDDCNIEIEYLIPKECSDGIPVISDSMSYLSRQCEFIINVSSLSKIVDVKVDLINKKAYIKAVLIPTKIWDNMYENEKGFSK